MGTGSEATGHFERALFLDSTFALAGLRLAEIAATYGMRERDERWKLDAIWRQRDRLGLADRALLVAYLGPRYPSSATLAGSSPRASGQQLAAQGQAWHNAGLTLFRFGSMIDRVGARAGGRYSVRSPSIRGRFYLDYLLLLAR
jgi:hypothetical protein